jgi:hypothetical protein
MPGKYLIILEGEFMAKKIAFFLIMVMIANMVVWADGGGMDDGTMVLLIVLGLAIAAIPLIFLLIDDGVAEAESPDDGIRLASMQTANSVSKTDSGTVLNILQHIEVGQTQDNKIYAGLHFRF